MLEVVVKSGDILDERVDVLISTANVKLLMSGGVNAAILMRNGQSVQAELEEHLRRIGAHYVAPGSVVRTGPGSLAVRHILHTVAITPFYESSIDLVVRALGNALEHAQEVSARSIAVPALATGYGPLTIKEFAQACRVVLEGRTWMFSELRIVLAQDASVEIVRSILARDTSETVGPYRLA
ncbi:macro domain-containing protein [bacterium]|nr:macro domain-containing protein [bacterium]